MEDCGGNTPQTPPPPHQKNNNTHIQNKTKQTTKQNKK